MTARKITLNTQEVETATGLLRRWFPVGATVSLVRLHTSASGASHTIKIVATANGEVFNVSWDVAGVLGMSHDDRRGAVVAKGGGMDMGFATVYDLAQVLHGDPRALTHRWI
jgi:hypothetical protein